ncbi:hypothetical protein [Pseudomonas rhizophila]
MTNKTITLSREKAIALAYADASNGASAMQLMDGWRVMAELRAALADPVPPAGVALQCWNCNADFTLAERADCDGCCWKCGNEIDLDDYVTRLQAEYSSLLGEHEDLIEKFNNQQSETTRLQAEVERLRDLHAKQTCVFCNDSGELLTKVSALQAELTKARELLDGVVAGTGTSPGANKRYGKIREFLSGQPTADDKRRRIKAERRYERDLRNAKTCERFVGYLLDNCEGEVIYEESLQHWMAEMLAKESNQSAPADKECAHRFMSLADDPRRCADCDAVEMHDKPVVRLELVRSGLSEGLHIRVWENLGNLWPGVHMLYLGPAAQPAPVAVVMPERKTVKAGLLSESNTHNQGWNACLDEVARLNPIKQ